MADLDDSSYLPGKVMEVLPLSLRSSGLPAPIAPDKTLNFKKRETAKIWRILGGAPASMAKILDG